MGIKLWQTREQLVDTLIHQRNLKCKCLSPKHCTCRVEINNLLKDINYFQMFNGLENILLMSNRPKDFGNIISVEDFKRLYYFDREISNEIFKAINIFEEKLQNSISYHFTTAYCKELDNTMQYTNRLNYKDISRDSNYPFSTGHYAGIKNTFNETRSGYEFKLFSSKFLNKLVKNNDMISPQFYKNSNYNPPIDVCRYTRDNKVAVPFWVAIQTFDFGTLKFVCHYLKNSEMNLVLADFGLNSSQRYMFLSALDVINELRNCCAHGRLIFKFRTPEYIKLNNNLVNTYSLSPEHGSGTRTTEYSVINLFDALIVLSKFVSVKSISKLFRKLVSLNNKALKGNAGRINNNILKAIKASSYSDLKHLY